MEPGDSCCNCRWWDRQPGTQAGFCRTQPPTRDADGWAAWPISNAQDWCAYFGPRLDQEPGAQEETAQ